MESFYDDLKLGRQADRAEIRRAYLRLATDWHPERWQERDPDLAEAMFVDLARAFNVLSDPEARARYDAWLDARLAAQPGNPPPAPETDDARTIAPQWNDPLTRSAADEIFSRQMLYFAAGLSAGGMNAAEVTQYLVAFGCPVSLAATIGKGAQNLGASDPTGDSSRASADSRNRRGLDGIPWPQAEPYFISYLSGAPEPERLDEDTFVLLSRSAHIRDWIALFVAATMLALLLLVRSLDHARPLLEAALGAGLLAAIATWVLGSLISAKRHPALRGERAIRKYLPAFRDIAEGRGWRWRHCSPGALAWGPAWAALHRMPWLASGWLILLGSAVVAALVYGLPLWWVACGHLIVSATFGAVASRLLMAGARRAIDKHMSRGWNEASRGIASRGRPNRWAAALAFALMILAALLPPPESPEPVAVATPRHPRPGSGASESGKDDPSVQAGDEAHRRAEEAAARVEALREFNRLKATYEAQYPELNPNARQYDAAVARRFEDRFRQLENEGVPAPDALKQALEEYAKDLRSRPRTSPQPGRAPDSGARPDPERDAPAENDPLKTICETFPYACRK